MITFSRDKTRVELSINLQVPYYEGRIFNFYWDAGTEWAAGLLTHALNEAHRAAVKKARGTAYSDGWKDAKSKKKAKEDWFAGVL